MFGMTAKLLLPPSPGVKGQIWIIATTIRAHGVNIHSAVYEDFNHYAAVSTYCQRIILNCPYI